MAQMSWYQYVITFARTVNGFPDESGPSPVSAAVLTSGGRTITRDPADGGNFIQASYMYGGATCSIDASTEAFAVTGMQDDPATGMTLLTLRASDGGQSFADGTKIFLAENPVAGTDSAGNPVYNLPVAKPLTIATGVHTLAALATPAPTAVLGAALPAGSNGRQFANGETVQYAVTAIRGAWKDLLNAGPAETPGGNSAILSPANGWKYMPSVSWTAVPGASGYGIYIKASTLTGGAWKLLTVVDAALTSFQDSAAITPGLWLNLRSAPPAVDSTANHILAVPIGTLAKNGVRAPKVSGSKFASIYTAANVTVHWAGITPTVGQIVKFTGALASKFPGYYQVQSVNAGASTFTIPGCAPYAISTTNYDQLLLGSMDYGNITGWNLYRASDGLSFSLVQENIPMGQLTVVDTVASSDLGRLLPTWYADDAGTYVTFAPPPTNLTQITVHAGMLFGLSGNMLRWTPVNRPDAWPLAYSEVLPSRPVALASYAGALFVLTMTGLHRVDVMTPSQISISQSLSEDGCIAPYSVAKTTKALIYLSQKGLVAFMPAANSTVPLVGFKLLARFFFMSSAGSIPFPHWWVPSRKTFAYNALTQYLPNEKSSGLVTGMTTLVDLTNPILTIKGFAVDDKYYLHYLNDPAFPNHGTLIADLDAPEPVVTFCGFRPLASHVASGGIPYALVDGIQSTGSVPPGWYGNGNGLGAPMDYVISQEGTDPNTLTTIEANYLRSTTKRYLLRMNQVQPPANYATVGGGPLNYLLHTGPMSLGAPQTRKSWDQVEFYGSGSFTVAGWADGYRVPTTGLASVVASETPSHSRYLNLPRNTRAYALDLEVVGNGTLTGIELGVTGMPSES